MAVKTLGDVDGKCNIYENERIYKSYGCKAQKCSKCH